MSNSKITVFITRPAALLHSVTHVLPSNRFEVHACPTVSIASTELAQAQKDFLINAANYDYIVFTSQYAVAETMKHYTELGLNRAMLNNSVLCAAGPMASAQLEKHGLHADLIPHQYTAEALAALMPYTTRPAKILFPKSNRSPGVLEPLLTKKGYTVDTLEIYHIEYGSNLPCDLMHAIQHQQASCIAFTSPSSAMAFAQLIPEGQLSQLHQHTTFAAIGATTKAACEAAKIHCAITPAQFTLQSLLHSSRCNHSCTVHAAITCPRHRDFLCQKTLAKRH